MSRLLPDSASLDSTLYKDGQGTFSGQEKIQYDLSGKFLLVYDIVFKASLIFV